MRYLPVIGLVSALCAVIAGAVFWRRRNNRRSATGSIGRAEISADLATVICMLNGKTRPDGQNGTRPAIRGASKQIRDLLRIPHIGQCQFARRPLTGKEIAITFVQFKPEQYDFVIAPTSGKPRHRELGAWRTRSGLGEERRAALDWEEKQFVIAKAMDIRQDHVIDLLLNLGASVMGHFQWKRGISLPQQHDAWVIELHPAPPGTTWDSPYYEVVPWPHFHSWLRQRLHESEMPWDSHHHAGQ